MFAEPSQIIGLYNYIIYKFKSLYKINYDFHIINLLKIIIHISDHLFGIVVSTSDCHPRGPRFDSRLYPRNFSGSIGSGTGPTQPREDNWVAT